MAGLPSQDCPSSLPLVPSQSCPGQGRRTNYLQWYAILYISQQEIPLLTFPTCLNWTEWRTACKVHSTHRVTLIYFFCIRSQTKTRVVYSECFLEFVQDGDPLLSMTKTLEIRNWLQYVDYNRFFACPWRQSTVTNGIVTLYIKGFNGKNMQLFQFPQISLHVAWGAWHGDTKIVDIDSDPGCTCDRVSKIQSLMC